MRRGPSEALVTKFLRGSLTVGAVGVSELEAKARAAGLLGERQSITTTKVTAPSIAVLRRRIGQPGRQLRARKQ
jgi:hypothetical protein